jgi:hypothetical protein
LGISSALGISNTTTGFRPIHTFLFRMQAPSPEEPIPAQNWIGLGPVHTFWPGCRRPLRRNQFLPRMGQSVRVWKLHCTSPNWTARRNQQRIAHVVREHLYWTACTGNQGRRTSVGCGAAPVVRACGVLSACKQRSKEPVRLKASC